MREILINTPWFFFFFDFNPKLLSIFIEPLYLGARKKPKNWLNWESQNEKNRTVKKNRLNRLKFWKNWPVWFRFYKSETEKTEPNRTQTKNQKKPSQTEKTEQNLFEPVLFKKTEPNRNRSVWTGFSLVSVFFFKF
jgi:hypothetical protein